MKKIILSAVLIIGFIDVFSQDSNMMYMKTDTMAMEKVKTYLAMTNGKVVMVKNGMSTPLISNKVLTDGTTVKINGTVLMKNGQSMMLKEGQWIGLDGKMMLKPKPDKIIKKDSV